MVEDIYNKLARILRVKPGLLLEIESKMNDISGREGVLEGIVHDNDIIIDRTLSELSLTRNDSSETVYSALVNHMICLDRHLYEVLDRPDLSKMSANCGKLCEMALKAFTPPRGLFIKRERVTELLDKYRPGNLLSHFGYSSAEELVNKEGFASAVSALRFTQSTDWMHEFFDKAYSELTPNDFEEREVELKILDPKWLAVADKFLEKKYHNVSHLKEFGVIFIIPLPIDRPGETLRLFSLILHYLHEIPFYTALFRRFFLDPNFADKFKSLLRGDISDEPMPDHGKMVWRVVQRYLAKDDKDDPRLAEQHVNPEAEHWLLAEEDLSRLSRTLGGDGGGALNLGYWTGLDFVGDFFKDASGHEQLVSFDLIDLIMSLVKNGEAKYLYHQQEALWNKIFSDYMGRERMNDLINENIINGFIELK